MELITTRLALEDKMDLLMCVPPVSLRRSAADPGSGSSQPRTCCSAHMLHQLMQAPGRAVFSCRHFTTLWALLPIVAVSFRADMDSHAASGSRAGHAVVGHKSDCSAAQGAGNSVAALLS